MYSDSKGTGTGTGLSSILHSWVLVWRLVFSGCISHHTSTVAATLAWAPRKKGPVAVDGFKYSIQITFTISTFEISLRALLHS